MHVLIEFWLKINGGSGYFVLLYTSDMELNSAQVSE